MLIIRFKAKRIKKILQILLVSKNLDPIFYKSLINTLNFISQSNINKSHICAPSSILLIYFNILPINIWDTYRENKLIKLNKEVSIYSLNRHKFSALKGKFLRNKLKFQLQKELYYTQNQRFLKINTSSYFEKLINVKYL